MLLSPPPPPSFSHILPPHYVYFTPHLPPSSSSPLFFCRSIGWLSWRSLPWSLRRRCMTTSTRGPQTTSIFRRGNGSFNHKCMALTHPINVLIRSGGASQSHWDRLQCSNNTEGSPNELLTLCSWKMELVRTYWNTTLMPLIIIEVTLISHLEI